MPNMVRIGAFECPGPSAIVLARSGSKSVQLDVQGPGEVGAGLRVFASDDAVTWCEIALVSGTGMDSVREVQPIYTPHPFLRVVVDWVWPGAIAFVSIRTAPFKPMGS